MSDRTVTARSAPAKLRTSGKRKADATCHLADELFRRVGEAAIKLRETERKLELSQAFNLHTVDEAIRNREELETAHQLAVKTLTDTVNKLKKENARLVRQLDNVK